MTSLFSRVWAAICTTVLILVLGASFGGASIRAQSPGKWKQLFNGKDLTGWQAIGGGGRRGGAPAAAPATPPAMPTLFAPYSRADSNSRSSRVVTATR